MRKRRRINHPSQDERAIVNGVREGARVEHMSAFGSRLPGSARNYSIKYACVRGSGVGGGQGGLQCSVDRSYKCQSERGQEKSRARAKSTHAFDQGPTKRIDQSTW